MSTTYTVLELDEDGTATPIGETHTKLDTAKEVASAHHLEIEGTSKVQVVTDTGHVSFEIEATEMGDPVEEVEALEDAEAPKEVVAEAVKRSKPWTKTDTADWAPEVDGYTLAYKRTRTRVAVYRANDKSDWLILDTRDGAMHKFPNTKSARVLVNELSDAYVAQTKKERDDAKAARDAEKAKAKADKAKTDTVDA